jgi:hypothetical protein
MKAAGWIRHGLVATMLSAPVLVPACSGTSGTVCDAICECELCNDRQEDECVIDVQRQIDVAEAYGCDAEATSYTDCVIDNNDCDENNFEVSQKCQDDAQDLFTCINDASGLTQGSSNGNGPGPGGDVCALAVQEVDACLGTTSPPPDTCDATNACGSNCILGASCPEIQDFANGAMGPLYDCFVTCGG